MIFSLSLIGEANELRVGMDVYCVTALGKSSFMEHHTVISQPHPKSYGMMFVDSVQHYPTWDFPTFVSLKDHNIGRDNGYNRHRAFFDEAAALAYMDNCKLLNMS